MLDPQEDGTQQHGEAFVPVFDADLLQRSDRAADAGVVVDDIEAAEFLDRARNQCFDFGFARDIGFLKDGAASALFAIAHRAFSPLDIEVGDYDCRALSGKAHRGAATDAAGSARYDRDFSIEPTHDRSPVRK